jgi:hypothetical protein
MDSQDDGVIPKTQLPQGMGSSAGRAVGIIKELSAALFGPRAMT